MWGGGGEYFIAPPGCLQAARVEIPPATKHLLLWLVAEATVEAF